VTPLPMPMPYAYSRRRNKAQLIKQMQKLHEQQEQAMLERQFKMEELMGKLRESDMPAEIIGMLEMQLGILVPPPMEVPDAQKLKAEEMSQLADRFASSFIEKTNLGWKLWDFNHLLASATRVEYDPLSEEIRSDFTPDGGMVEATGNKTPLVILYCDEDPMQELTGKTALAFIRYLHYLGIFELEAAKKPCPDCGNKPPQDCEICGGLGWVL
jgi:hypothetical protein